MNTDYFWFALFMTRGIGPKALCSIARVIEKNNIRISDIPSDSKKLAEQHPELWKKLDGKIDFEEQNDLYSRFESLTDEDVFMIHPGLSFYPEGLLELSERFSISPVLFGRGEKSLLSSTGVAIVGARSVSEKGLEITGEIASGLAGAGMNVVSGYAKGVDSKAHFAALDAEGTTTIVLSEGIKEFRVKKELGEFRWDRDVLVVSQFQPDSPWMARSAMMRNKLTCALSRAVIVVESGPEKDERGKMSGTFNTARTALEMNLPLFVVSPSSLDKPPPGNQTLIDIGAIELNPPDYTDVVISNIESNKNPGVSAVKDKKSTQTMLFQD